MDCNSSRNSNNNNNSGSKAAASSSLSSFERIEQLEAELLQHVHAAGLRSNRERQIADEVSALRLERRKLFSSLTKEIESLRNETSSSSILFEEKMQAQKAKYKSAINELLQKNEEYRNKISFFKCDLRRVLDEEREKLNKKYEGKILLLDRKMTELGDVDRKQVLMEAEKIATLRIAENETNIEKVFLKKIDKYKQTINNLVDKEKTINNLVKENEYLASEITILKRKISELEKNIGEAKAINSNINEVLNKINYEIQAKDGLISDLTNANSSLISDHKLELDSVDAKIRQILATKDATIADLKAKCESSERDRKSMESLLVKLNKSFRVG